MTSNEHFDEHLRSLFNQYTPPVPAGAWNTLNQRRRRRKWLVWWRVTLAGLLVLVLAGAAYWLVPASQRSGLPASVGQSNGQQHATAAPRAAIPPSVTHTSAAAPHPVVPPPTATPQVGTVIGSSPAHHTGDAPTGAQGMLPDALHSSPVRTTAKHNAKSQGATRSLRVSRSVSPGPSATASLVTPASNHQPASVNHAPIGADDAEPEAIHHTPFNPSAERHTAEHRPSHWARTTSTGRTRIKAPRKAVTRMVPAQATGIITDDVVAAAADDDAFYPSAIPANPQLLRSGAYAQGKPVVVAATLLSIPVYPKPQVHAAGNREYWELYAGPDLAFKQYRDTAQTAYLEQRRATTTRQLAFSAGFRYTRVFANGISFRTGLNYTQINERFSLVQNNYVLTTYDVNPVTGDTTGVNRLVGTRYRTTFNRFRSVDIPLLFGYEMGNQRWRFNLNAGVMVNLYNWQRGDVLDSALQPVRITTGGPKTPYDYRTNAGVAFSGAASVYYRLRKQTYLFAEPYIRYQLSPISSSALSLQEKFTLLGLRLGIRKDF